MGQVSGLLTPGNIDLHNRPIVKNPDGSISTVRSITIDDGGKAVLIPTVVGNRVVSNSDAIAAYRKTGQHLGVFRDEASADAYAQQLHEDQAAEYMPKANMTLDQQKAIALASARMRAARAAQAQPRSGMAKFGDEVSGVMQSLYDLPQSIVELGARGMDAIGLTDKAYPTLHGAFQQGNNAAAEISGSDPNSGFYKGGRIVGNVLTTIPLTELKAAEALPLLGNLPKLAKVADAAAQGASAAALTSNSSDAPLGTQLAIGAGAGAALPVLGGVARTGLGKVLPSVLGDLATGAGGSSVKGAFNAGLAGGDAAQAFTDSLRGNTPWGQVVTDAKTALGNMRAQRNAAYRSGMADISKDATVLSFEPLDKAMGDASKIKVFRGRSGAGPAQNLSKSTSKVQQEVADAIDNWKSLDPIEYHTPEGFDALKQQLGDIRDQYDYNTPQRLVAENAYNAVRQTIADQAPAYNKVMQDYSKASDAVDEIQKELSLGKRGNPSTALRKLQSVMRDNANTSWGDRATKAATLADNGAPNLLPALAGQALSPIIPRGLAKYGDLAAAAAGGLTNPLTLAALPLASPRVVGEAAYGLGAIGRGVTNMAQRLPLQLPKRAPATAMGVLAPQLLLAGAQ